MTKRGYFVKKMSLFQQGNRIKRMLKKKEEGTIGKGWRGAHNGHTNQSLNYPGPRIERGKKHLLVDILLLCIIAMVCGVESVEDINFFGETHRNWLKDYLFLPNGIPIPHSPFPTLFLHFF
jgi:hypothetical protein